MNSFHTNDTRVRTFSFRNFFPSILPVFPSPLLPILFLPIGYYSFRRRSTTEANMQPDLTLFDPAASWTIKDAANSGLLNVRGRRPSIQVVQRWASRKRGHRPLGEHGPTIYLPAIKYGREYLTMRVWVEWFATERQRLIVERMQRLQAAARGPATQEQLEKRAAEARKRARV